METEVLKIIAGLRERDHFTDLIVRCENKTFNVHKIIVSGWSEWFKIALTSGFKEGSSGEIALIDDDEDDVSNMIHFCYHMQYPDMYEGSLTLHARMFALGEKYLVPAMQAYAVSKFRTSLARSFIIADFAGAVKECYTNSMDPKRLLKTVVLETSVGRARELFVSNASDADFRQMVHKLPEYTADVLRNVVNTYKCPTHIDFDGLPCSGTVELDAETKCGTCSCSYAQYNTAAYKEYWRSRAI